MGNNARGGEEGTPIVHHRVVEAPREEGTPIHRRVVEQLNTPTRIVSPPIVHRRVVEQFNTPIRDDSLPIHLPHTPKTPHQRFQVSPSPSPTPIKRTRRQQNVFTTDSEDDSFDLSPPLANSTSIQVSTYDLNNSIRYKVSKQAKDMLSRHL